MEPSSADPMDDVIEADSFMNNPTGENMEEESPTVDIPMDDSNYCGDDSTARRRTMETFRVNRVQPLRWAKAQRMNFSFSEAAD